MGHGQLEACYFVRRGFLTDDSCPDESVFVALSGGLGNQLFQLAAGLFVADGSQVVLESEYLSPRQWFPGIPDVAGFTLPSNVSMLASVSPQSPSLGSRLGVRFAMRSGLVADRWDASLAVRQAAASVTSRLAAKRLGCRCALFSGTGHGYDPALEAMTPPILLVGYFQSWKYAAQPEVRLALLDLAARSDDPWIQDMKELAEKERPLIVHVRLGDYRHDDSFGIPGPGYYLDALREQISEPGFERVWVFSDEPTRALERLPLELQRLQPRVINAPRSVDPAGILEVMRYGSSYILTNSTFGYWAALLSGCAENRVSIPEPWFSGVTPFTDFAPPGWRRCAGTHDSQ